MWTLVQLYAPVVIVGAILVCLPPDSDEYAEWRWKQVGRWFR